MTEAGEKWLDDIGINRSASDAEKAIRAFCEEAEKRADEISLTHNNLVAEGLAFRELKRELLG